jgi:hypothetical protein
MAIDRHWHVAGGLLACVLALSCSSPTDPPPAPACVTVNANCQPLFDPPTYASLFTMILQPTCASGTHTCHTSDTKKGGLVFEDATDSYNLLLGMGADHRARVLPDNPGCSILMERLQSKDPAFQMPPGNPLSDAQICDFAKWLTAGAKNN